MRSQRSERYAGECCRRGDRYSRTIRLVSAELAAKIFHVALDDIFMPTRGPSGVAFARQVAMYQAHVVGGLTLSRVGELFGRDRTTVSHACAVVEDRRDNARLDLALGYLDRAVLSMTAGCRQRAGR